MWYEGIKFVWPIKSPKKLKNNNDILIGGLKSLMLSTTYRIFWIFGYLCLKQNYTKHFSTIYCRYILTICSFEVWCWSLMLDLGKLNDHNFFHLNPSGADCFIVQRLNSKSFQIYVGNNLPYLQMHYILTEGPKYLFFCL